MSHLRGQLFSTKALKLQRFDGKYLASARAVYGDPDDPLIIDDEYLWSSDPKEALEFKPGDARWIASDTYCVLEESSYARIARLMSLPMPITSIRYSGSVRL
jgi:hypothetical protein